MILLSLPSFVGTADASPGLPGSFHLSFASDMLPAASADRFDFKGLAQCLDFFTPMACERMDVTESH